MRLLAVALVLSIGVWLPLAALGKDVPVACPDAYPTEAFAGSECLLAQLPLRHETSEDANIEVFVRRVPALDAAHRRGEVWLIAGGPGEPGVALHPAIATFRAAFPDHDLVIPDHRGTGRSTRLCPVQEALDSPDGVALADTEWGPCIGAMYADPARTAAFSTTQAAQDLSTLIARHRHEGEVHLYGVSYGTQLALRMLQVAPQPLDGLILDGLVSPESAPQWDLGHRTALVDEVGRAVLGAEAAATYARVLSDDDPQAAWRAHVPNGDLRRTLGSLLNFPSLRDRLPEIVEALARDDAAPLQAALAELRDFHAQLMVDPVAPPALPLVMLVAASENNGRRDLDHATVEAEARDALFTSAIPGFLVDTSVPMYPRDAYFGHTPTQLPRTLVIHGTLDPNTSHAGALAHVALLARAGDVQMTTVERGAHLLTLFAPDCFVTSTKAFLAGQAVQSHCASLDPPH